MSGVWAGSRRTRTEYNQNSKEVVAERRRGECSSAQPREGDIIAATYAHFESTEVARAALAAVGQDLLESVPNYSTLTPQLVLSIVTSH